MFNTPPPSPLDFIAIYIYIYLKFACLFISVECNIKDAYINTQAFWFAMKNYINILKTFVTQIKIYTLKKN